MTPSAERAASGNSRTDSSPAPTSAVDRGITCRELVELVTDYLDDALATAERERFEAHIAACEGCASYLEQLRSTIMLTGRTRALEQRPEMAALVALFRGTASGAGEDR